MKHNAPTPENHHSQHSEEWDKNDPLWDLLGQASTQEPDAFFARNVVRSARQLTPERSTASTLGSRILSLFTSRKLALSAVACTCALVTFQLWPESQPDPKTSSAPEIAQTTQPQIATEDTATSFSELVIEESLLAAADDPSLFTRDELVAMLDL